MIDFEHGTQEHGEGSEVAGCQAIPPKRQITTSQATPSRERRKRYPNEREDNPEQVCVGKLVGEEIGCDETFSLGKVRAHQHEEGHKKCRTTRSHDALQACALPNESRLSCGRRARQRKGPAPNVAPRRASERPIPLRAGPTASSAG